MHDDDHDEDKQVYKRNRTADNVENSVLVSEDTVEGGSKRLLGIRQIWVHSTRRRQHIAQCLVDTARQHALFGSIVLRSDIAFAQPTNEGKHSSTQHHQRTCLVYPPFVNPSTRPWTYLHRLGLPNTLTYLSHTLGQYFAMGYTKQSAILAYT